MEPTLKISIQDGGKDSKYSLIKFNGEFDKAGYSDVREALDKFLDAFGAKESSINILLFDFSDLKYVNSQGIGVLMEINTKLQELGKKLVIVGMNANVTDIFKTIGMTEIVSTYKNLTTFLDK